MILYIDTIIHLEGVFFFFGRHVMMNDRIGCIKRLRTKYMIIQILQKKKINKNRSGSFSVLEFIRMYRNHCA